MLRLYFNALWRGYEGSRPAIQVCLSVDMDGFCRNIAACGAHLAHRPFTHRPFKRTTEKHNFQQKSPRFLSGGTFEFALRCQVRVKVLSIRREI